MNNDHKLKAVIFDLSYEIHYGIIIYVRVYKGELKIGQKIKIIQKEEQSQSNRELVQRIEKIGINNPNKVKKEKLENGEIGWITTGIKEIDLIKTGSIIVDREEKIEQENLFSFLNNSSIKPNIRPGVFCNVFPDFDIDFENLRKSFKKLLLQDNSILSEQIDSTILGKGYRCGFSGILHRDIFCERLKKEFFCPVIITEPNANYLITTANNEKKEITNPSETINLKIKDIEELMINLKIVVPEEFVGKIMSLCKEYRGRLISQTITNESSQELIFIIPFEEFIHELGEKIKVLTSGYVFFNYESCGYEKNKIVRVDFLLNDQLIPDFSFFVHQSFSHYKAKKIIQKIKSVLKKQLFTISIKACVGNKVITSEKIIAKGKNVTGNLYGGDRTRKMKLWKKQKEGKKKMKQIGKKEKFNVGKLKKIFK